MTKVKSNNDVQVNDTQGSVKAIENTNVTASGSVNILQQADTHKSVGTKMVFSKENNNNKPKSKKEEVKETPNE